MEETPVLSSQLSHSNDGGGLSRDLLKKAEEELNENPEFRDRIIQEFREMVQAESELHCRTDDAFLLRFLRAKKFDLGRCFSLLKNYYRTRDKHNLSDKFRPSAVLNVFEKNVLVVFPERDTLGRRIFRLHLGNWDPSDSTLDDVYVATYLCFEKVISEEETQINGVVAIIDWNGFGLKQATHVTPRLIKKFVSLVQNVFPSRFKGFHVINQPQIFYVIYAIAKNFLNEKIRSRVFLHGSDLESLHSHFPPQVLPEELAGLLPATDHLAFLNTLLEREHEFVLESKFGYRKENSD